MLPYFEWKIIDIGPITLQVWGIFVALGFLLGAYMAAWMLRRKGLNQKVVYDLLPWLIFAGIIGGRLGYVVFYDLPYYLQHPLEALAVWSGGSSIFGGLIACVAVAMVYFNRKKLDALLHADAIVFGLPFGIILGRIGCFLIHDHPGTATDFILGVKYPDGVVRHDLGLNEAIAMMVLSGVFVWLARKSQPTGTYLAVFSLFYGAIRIAMDFYRVADTRYAGLTPAQYLCLGLIVFGAGVLMWIRRQQKQA